MLLLSVMIACPELLPCNCRERWHMGIWCCADIVDIMRRMKLLGFNAIRMPFSMQDLYHATPRDFQWQYCTNVDGPTFLQSVTNPHVSPPTGVHKHAIWLSTDDAAQGPHILAVVSGYVQEWA